MHTIIVVWFLVSIWAELKLKTYQALELIRVLSVSFLSLHPFRNGNVQLYAWVSHANFLKGTCPPSRKVKLYSSSPYHPLWEIIDFSCSNKSKPLCWITNIFLLFSSQCDFFSSVILIRMGNREVVGEKNWRGEQCFLCLRLAKILSSLEIFPFALFFKSYSSWQLFAKPFHNFTLFILYLNSSFPLLLNYTYYFL